MRSGAEVIGHPWATIWTRPRATIRRIVETDVRYQVTMLAVLSGALIWLERRWASPSPAAAFPMLVVMAVIIGAILGVIELYVNGALLKWAGHALGGVASYAEVRAALAWSRVPVIVAVAIGVLAILLGTDGPMLDENREITNSGASLLLLHGFLVLWGFVVMLKCVGEVHRFSAWRALGSILLIIGAIVLLLIAMILVFGGIGRLMHPLVWV
ncbi:MAG TPA: YIP1 family protein [Candidatus Binataceae bacterium]|nr:YIP1 family protein [Candidatus Binataceae bacterium]